MPRPTRLSRQKTLITAAVCSFWAVLVLVVVIGSIPSSPLAFSRWSRTTLVSVMPEGWGFFTMNPREAYVVMYRPTSSGLQPVNVVGSRLPQVFGARRSARGRELEFG